MKKVCSNFRCELFGEKQDISAFYKKGASYDSQCKNCIKKSKRLNRLKKKRSIISDFNIRFERPDKGKFVEALIPLFEGEMESG